MHSDAFVALEQWLPFPLARCLKNYRDLPETSAFERIDALTKAAEVMIKLLATMSSKFYLLDGAEDPRFRDAVQQISRASLGQWTGLLRLSLKPYQDKERTGLIACLFSFYEERRASEKPVADAVMALCSGTQGEVKKPGGKLTNAVILDVLVQFRNFVAHGAQLRDHEWAVLLENVLTLLGAILPRLDFFQRFILFYVEEVRVEKSGSEDLFMHKGRTCRGREIERRQVIGADSLQDQRLYLAEVDRDDHLHFAIDLSPFFLFQNCTECHAQQVFVFNSVKGKRIAYLSYQCGHRYDVDDIAGEFTDIYDFVRGKISLDNLFAGKVLGKDLDRAAAGVSEEERRRATALTRQARAQLNAGLSREARKILEDSVRLNPDGADTHYLIGLCQLLEQGDVRTAIDALKEAVRLEPHMAPADFVLAYIFFRLHAFALASTWIDAAISQDPSSQHYRQFREELPDLQDGVAEEQLDYIIEPEAKSDLAGLAQRVLSVEGDSRVKVRNWTDAIPPWRWIRGAPLLGSAAVSIGILTTVLLLQGDELTAAIAAQQVAIASIYWLGLYGVFLGSGLVGATFTKLLPVVAIPEDTFKRFYLRQCSFILGNSCPQEPGDGAPSVMEVLRKDWRHVLMAVAFFLMLLPLQYLCADDPFEFRVPVLARYFAYVFEAFAVSWMAGVAVLGLRFIPGFVGLPQRYFLGMPDSVSLRPLGSLFLQFALLASLVFTGALAQHYAFRTHATSSVASYAYIVVCLGLVASVLLLSQLVIRHALSQLKERKLTEYSYHVESAFDAFIKSPTAETYDRMARQKSYIKELKGLNTAGLPEGGILIMAALVLYLVGLTAGYLYLVTNGIWGV